MIDQKSFQFFNVGVYFVSRFLHYIYMYNNQSLGLKIKHIAMLESHLTQITNVKIICN